MGVTLAGLILIVVAQAGVDYGLPGQVAMRATFGQIAARGLTSPYRTVAAVALPAILVLHRAYWFAAQAIAGAFGLQAIVRGLIDHELPLVPVAVGIRWRGRCPARKPDGSTPPPTLDLLRRAQSRG